LQINVSVIIAALQISLNLNSAFAQSRPNVISIENVTLVSMEDDRLTPVERLIVTGDRISAIVSSGGTGTPAGVLVIDGTNRFLLPGFVDSHVHLTTDMPWARAAGLWRCSSVSGARRDHRIQPWRYANTAGVETPN
jgi:hypothetical protein